MYNMHCRKVSASLIDIVGVTLCSNLLSNLQWHLQVLPLPAEPYINTKIDHVPHGQALELHSTRAVWNHPALRCIAFLCREEDTPRGFVVALLARHPFWRLKNAEELRSNLERASP